MFTVNSTADNPDANLGDGVCGDDIESPNCTLRAAIQEADANPGDYKIVFDPEAGTTYNLTHTGNNEDAGATGDLDVTGGSDMNLSIVGNGSDATIIDGQASNIETPADRDRVFDIPFSGPTVAISGVTMQNGQWSNNGAIVKSVGDLTISDSVIQHGKAAHYGGGIYSHNGASLALHNVSVNDNNALRGGGIFNNSDGADGTGGTPGLIIDSNSKILSNSADQNCEGSCQGGGVFNDDEASISNTLFDDNYAVDSGGGIFNSFGISTQLNVAADLTLANDKVGTLDSGNWSTGPGGGIYNDGSLNATGTSVVYNYSEEDDGAGIYNGGLSQQPTAVLNFSLGSITDNEAGADGGGIYNEPLGRATVTTTTLARNYNDDGSGGAIANAGRFTLDRSTVSDNGAEFNRTSSHGGGVLNEYGPLIPTDTIDVLSRATFDAVNSTFSGNTAIEGGGIYNESDLGVDAPDVPAPTVNLTNVTIADNKVIDGSGAGIYNAEVPEITADVRGDGDGLTNLRNTLLALNPPSGSVGHNCGGANPVSQGHNLEDSDSCGLASTGDHVNTPAGIGPLANNGGPTFTHALLAGSKAIDAATAAPATDQRGVGRPQGVAPDIGAYEFVFPTIPPPPAPSADVSVVKTENGTTFRVGNAITYTLSVHNAGPSAAAGVNVSDALPAGMTFVSATPSQGSCTGTTTVSCALGTLANGASATVTVVVRTTAAGTRDNTGVVIATTADPVTANNSSTVSAVVNAVRKPVARCRVPNVKGNSLAQARRAIAKAGCKLGLVGRRTVKKSGAVNRVVAQSPHGGVLVARGSRVNVTLGLRVRKPRFTG